jgi:RNA polymerase sigma-70 factor (ECF subfamily)
MPVALRYARDPAEADDILQEALMRAWRMRGSCRSPDAPWAWLRQITANEALRLRAREREEPPLAAAEAPYEDPELERVADADAVRQALAALGRGERDVVQAFYFEDRSVPELALRLGLTVAAAKVRLHRARARMLSALMEE